jgi:hypothetical protein
MARLYREAPVNSIWEGSGNVMCLDVLRAIARTPDDALRLVHDIGERAHGHRAVRAELAALQAMLHQPGDIQETSARRIAQGLALTAQAALMLAYAHPDDAERVRETFVAARELGRTEAHVPDNDFRKFLKSLVDPRWQYVEISRLLLWWIH